MKHIKAIALAVAVISVPVANVSAGEVNLKAPDISGKLNSMVESKMTELVKQAYLYRGYTQIVELRPDGSAYLPAVYIERMDHDVKANRS